MAPSGERRAANTFLLTEVRGKAFAFTIGRWGKAQRELIFLTVTKGDIMKLTRNDLIHATNVQLRAIGLCRDGNAGWLKEALERDFTRAEVELFHKARKKTKATAKEIYTIKLAQDAGGTWTAICPAIIASGIGPTASEALKSLGFCIESTLLTKERACQPPASV